MNTIEQIDELASLKKKYGQLSSVTVEGVEKPFVFRRADRNVLAAVAKLAAKDPIEATAVMIKNTLVVGDGTLLDDISILQALGEAVEQINRPRAYELKNL